MTKRKPWFSANGFLQRRIPRACVFDCSASGDVTRAVEHWRQELNFEVPRELAERWLQGFGAWEPCELGELSNEELAEKVLWLACCDIKESGEWFGLVE